MHNQAHPAGKAYNKRLGLAFAPDRTLKFWSCQSRHPLNLGMDQSDRKTTAAFHEREARDRIGMIIRHAFPIGEAGTFTGILEAIFEATGASITGSASESTGTTK